MTHPIIPPYLHTLSIPTPFPVGSVNVYLAEGDPLTLVDAGPRYGPARESLESGLDGRGYGVADVRRIVLTHAHADHCGLAAELARASGAEVLTHAVSVPWLEKSANARRLAFYAEVMRWAGVPVKTLVDLSRLRDISSNPVVEPPAPGETGRPRRLVEYMAQLRRVAALDVALALPGHGPPITDHRALIRERLAFHEARARHMLEVMGERALTAHEMAGVLFPGVDPVDYFLAISEVVGHLQWLEAEGRLMHDEHGGVARWRRAS